MRLPLHMRLLIEADIDLSAPVTTFELIGSFVDAALRGHDEGTRAQLVRAAIRQEGDLAAVWIALGVSGTAAHNSTATVQDKTSATSSLPVLHSVHDRSVFVHDVIAEYLVASELCRQIRAVGRTLAAARALNELASAATSSAATRGVMALLICGLDLAEPDLLAALVLMAALDSHVTLPLIVRLGAQGHMRFLDNAVILGAARRLARADLANAELARAVLGIPQLPEALAHEFPTWLRTVLRLLSSTIWPDVALCIQRGLDPQQAQSILGHVDFTDPTDSVFVARYFYLFFDSQPDPSGRFNELLGHADWRVRAALAEGLEHAAAMGPVQLIAEALICDVDYKVRAAAAQKLATLGIASARDLLPRVLNDESWHVRSRALLGLTPPRTPIGLSNKLRAVLTQATWRTPPPHIAPLLARVALCHRLPDLLGSLPESAVERAVFRILREARTGIHRLPAHIQQLAREKAQNSQNWIVGREAAATATSVAPSGKLSLTLPSAAVSDTSVFSTSREAFRRLRGQKTVQVALDLHNVEQAVAIAVAAASAGARIFEVGDPLIKIAGVGAITAIKQAIPDRIVVAEMMSADWGRDQVELAAEAGADVVLLIGLASHTSIAAAVGAGHRLGVPIMLDMPHPTSPSRVRDVERVGVDALVVTTNVDHGHRGSQPLDRARQLRTWTQLPIAVSGGFGGTDRHILKQLGLGHCHHRAQHHRSA